MASRDPRWYPSRFIVLTLFSQLVFAIIIASLSFTSFAYNNWLIYYPAPLSLATILLNIILLSCYAGGHLHPLVCLTFACQFLVAHLCATIFATVALRLDDSYQCASRRDGEVYPWTEISYPEYRYNYYGNRASRGEVCGKSIAAVVFQWLMLLSYIWLVAYSAIVRKRTRMPYVRVDKNATVTVTGQVKQTGGSPRFSGVAYNPATTAAPATAPTPAVQGQQPERTPGVMSGGRASETRETEEV